jgi:hypothetical protein
MICPSATSRVTPVIQEAQSEARNSTAQATSSGVPSRPSGYMAVSCRPAVGGDPGLQPLGQDGRRGHAVDPHAVAGRLLGDFLGEPDHPRLGDRITGRGADPIPAG